VVKRIIPFFFLVLSPGVVFGDFVQFRDGTIKQFPQILYRDGCFLPDSLGLSRDNVRSISFVKPGEEPPEEAEELAADVSMLTSAADSMQNRYPDAAGILIIDDGKYILRSDGTRSYIYHFAGKIIKSSKLSWGTRSIWIEPERSRANFIFARTITPEGKIFYLDPRDVKISEQARGESFFSYGKIITANLPMVSEGCIVEYMFERETFNPYDKNMFFPGWYFQGYEPVYLSRYTVEIPKGKEIIYKSKNIPPEFDSPEISETDTSRLYVWEITDIPPITPEKNMPDYGDVVMHLEGSIFKDYEYIFDWLGGFQKNRVVITPQIDSLVHSLTDTFPRLWDKVAQIYYFVQREIRYISIKGSISSGQTGHPAQLTLENKYGDCTDKSILLATMLRVLGVPAWPIIVMTNSDEEIDRSIPSIDGNHCITQIQLDGENIFLDATSTTHRFPYYRDDDVGVSYLNPMKREIGFTSIPLPEDNSDVTIMDITVHPDRSILVVETDSLVGDEEADWRGFWEYVDKKKREYILQGWVNYAAPGAKLASWEIENVTDLNKPLRQVFSFTADDYGTLANGLLIFPIPFYENSYNFPEAATSERKFDIEYSSPRKKGHRVTISIPDGWKIEQLPEDLELSNEYADFSASWTVKGNKIMFVDSFRLKARFVPVEDYQMYREFLNAVSVYAKHNRPVFKVN